MSKVTAPMNDEARWRAEDDARTLQRAAEVMGDKSRMKAAQTHVAKTVDQLQRVSQLATKPAASKSRSSSLGFSKGRK